MNGKRKHIAGFADGLDRDGVVTLSASWEWTSVPLAQGGRFEMANIEVFPILHFSNR